MAFIYTEWLPLPPPAAAATSVCACMTIQSGVCGDYKTVHLTSVVHIVKGIESTVTQCSAPDIYHMQQILGQSQILFFAIYNFAALISLKPDQITIKKTSTST